MASWILYDDFSEQTFAVITTCVLLLIYCWPLEMNKIRMQNSLGLCSFSERHHGPQSAQIPGLSWRIGFWCEQIHSSVGPAAKLGKEMLFWSISSGGKHWDWWPVALWRSEPCSSSDGWFSGERVRLMYRGFPDKHLVRGDSMLNCLNRFTYIILMASNCYEHWPSRTTQGYVCRTLQFRLG